MAVNKNFVVKNGLEVNSDLIVADSTTKNVGIGSTIPSYTLEVVGGIGVTNIYSAGITTIKDQLRVGTGGTALTVIETGGLVGVGTTNPAYRLDVRTSSGATTGTTVLYVLGDAEITGNLDVGGDIVYDEVTGKNLYIAGFSTFVGMSTFKSDVWVGGALTVTGNLDVTGDITYDEVSGRNINISGLSTFEGLSYFGSNVGVGTTNPAIGADPNNTNILNVGILTANYIYGDISGATGVATGVSAAIGVSSEGTFVGSGATIVNFASSNGTAWDITVSSGVATATVTPGASLGMVLALGG